MRLVLVEWLDSFGCSATWEQLDGCSPHLLTCRSVGWLIHDGDDCKVIVPHVSQPNEGCGQQGCGDMTIPTRAIVRMADLSESSAA
jgi:hypothetical protein